MCNRKVLPKQIWANKDNNPWESTFIRIIDVKNKWIKYYYCKEDGYRLSLRWSTMRMNSLRILYQYYKDYVQPQKEEESDDQLLTQL